MSQASRKCRPNQPRLAVNDKVEQHTERHKHVAQADRVF